MGDGFISGSLYHPGSAQSGSSKIRTFDSGATRDTDTGKHDYEGFLSPLVIKRFAEYMTSHRHQADGKLRDSDNWQKGIPKKEYIKSLFRHFMDLWLGHRATEQTPFIKDKMEEALCGILFNAQGYLHEVLKEEVELQSGPACGCMPPDSDSSSGSAIGYVGSRVFTYDVKVGGSDPDEVPF